MDNPDFFLASSEGYRMEEPRSCKRIKRVRSDHRDDLLLVKVEPPLIGQPYGFGGRDIDTLLIATRHKGYSLFPIKEWPVYVHVACLLIENPEEREQIHGDEFESIAWAELYRTEEDARTELRRRYSKDYAEIMKRGRIKNEAEYYILRNVLDDPAEMAPEERELLVKLISDYEGA